MDKVRPESIGLTIESEFKVTYVGTMTAEQRARAEALYEARCVLESRSPAGSAAVDAMDLYNIASYIITGEDPWNKVMEIATKEQRVDG